MIYTTVWVFITNFLNTGFLLMLANANLVDQNIPILDIFLRGPDPDFNIRWFTTVGEVLVSTMIINIFIDPATQFGMFMMRTVLRMLDSGILGKYEENEDGDIQVTKCLSKQQYIDKYSGPDYQMDVKYAALLNVVYVTMVFGVGIPILFPIALIYFVLTYLIEVATLYYSYRKPSSYDEKLTVAVLDILVYAPLFYFAFGYWFLSNK